MRLLLDMNIPQGWVEYFLKNGYEAIHWRKVGDIRAEDCVIMKWARENGHVVFTHDLDFGSLLYATNAKKPSVIQLRMENITSTVAGEIVVKALQSTRSEIEQGALVTIDPKRHRVHVLPLRN